MHRYGLTAVEDLTGHVVELLVELFEERFDLGDRGRERQRRGR